jgi:hypothetical protein
LDDASLVIRTGFSLSQRNQGENPKRPWASSGASCYRKASRYIHCENRYSIHAIRTTSSWGRLNAAVRERPTPLVGDGILTKWKFECQRYFYATGKVRLNEPFGVTLKLETRFREHSLACLSRDEQRQQEGQLRVESLRSLYDSSGALIAVSQESFPEKVADWPLAGLSAKLIAPTAPTAARCEFQLFGTSYPTEGAHGLGFPFQNSLVPIKPASAVTPQRTPRVNRLSGHPSKQEMRVNGFRSREIKDSAHLPLLEAISRSLAGLEGAVLDLGCGDGTLLKKITELVPNTVPYGIDIRDSAVATARKSMPQFAKKLLSETSLKPHNLEVSIPTGAPWTPTPGRAAIRIPKK